MNKYELVYYQPYERVMSVGESVGYTPATVVILADSDGIAKEKMYNFFDAEPIKIAGVTYRRKIHKMSKIILEE